MASPSKHSASGHVFSLLSQFAYQRTQVRSSEQGNATNTHADADEADRATPATADSSDARDTAPIPPIPRAPDWPAKGRVVAPWRQTAADGPAVATASDETLRKWTAFCNPLSNIEVQRYQMLVAVQVRLTHVSRSSLSSSSSHTHSHTHAHTQHTQRKSLIPCAASLKECVPRSFCV